MKFSELTVLLPCHGLEDFPVYLEGAEADAVLAAWCAPWHPALVAAAQRVPVWHRIDIPPGSLAEMFLAVPPFCTDRLPSGYLTRAEQEGALVVTPANLHEASATPAGAAEIDPEAVADFMALGFCRLQMELLTRQMRYAISIDETFFQNETVAAAQAAVAGDTAGAREHLEQCFEVLYDSRKHFYPVDVHLIAVTLLAETTLGASLAAELAAGTPTNLLTTSSLLEKLSAEHADTWQALLRTIDDGNACVLGGEVAERESPLLPVERALASLVDGAKQYETLLGRPPVVYGRRRAGLWPALPQLLTKLGSQGALHFTLDDGRFPLGPQCKTRWEGVETSVLDIFARVPCDATKPESYLALSRTMSDSMDSDHVATVAFAHWPSAASPWHDLLRRVSRFCPVLGKFMLLDDYFLHTDMPGRLSKFEADDYRVPYLKQAIIRRQSDPISTFQREHRQQAEQTAASALATTADLIAGSASPADAQPTPAEALERLAALLPRGSGAEAPRVLVFNSANYARRIEIAWPPDVELPAVEKPVVAAGTSEGRKFAVAEVPSLGFVWLAPGTTQPAKKREQPLAADNVLGNEFMEVRISRSTGGIQALYNYAQRGNQLSQQLAARLPGGGDQYTTMKADRVEVTAASTVYGEIVSSGALVDAGGEPLARFRQTTSLWAGSRVVHLDLELSDVEEPRADPWNSYYAARFAWPDEMAELWRGVSSARQRTRAGRIEAPEFVDIDTGGGTLSILTLGLPYHRRSDPRMLDSLLVVRGESERRFRMAIGVDLPHPAATATELLTPPLVRLETTAPPAAASGWFFHTGGTNIVATHWAPIVDEADGTRVRGFRARFLEVGGRAGRVPLRTFRRVSAARQVNFLGEPILQLSVDDERIMLDFGPHELLEIEALWVGEAADSQD
ncbi:MAG: hypothetical protein DWQ37_06875 [Planctomycetota bacterium]|nr:MAG: hypothetical protein DWQ37_06875 [Planctomycetota bacterium]